MATFPRRRFLQGSLTALATAAGCGRRKGTGFAGYAFVANEESRSVAAVDLTAFAVRRHIVLDASPAAIVAHPQQAYVYALAPAAGTVYEIDAAALKIRRKVRAGGPLVSMRMAPGAGALWLLCREPKSLIRLGLDAFREAARIRLPAAAGDFDL